MRQIRSCARTAFLVVTLAVPAASAAPPVRIADLLPGAAASVAGVVDRILDEDEFMLRDPSGAIQVYIGPNRMPVGPGDSVTVQGVLDDDGGRELYADALTLTTGQVIVLSRRDD